MLITYRDKVGGKVIRVTANPCRKTRLAAVQLAIMAGFNTLLEIHPNGKVQDITEWLENRKPEVATV
ncbi:hypothetical protein [Adhaeribacter arboris]|nr:hypothetical protein [Adhaeribacter arboris]